MKLRKYICNYPHNIIISKNFEIIMVKVFGAKALRSPSPTSPRKTFCLQLSRALSCSSSKAQTRSPWSVHWPMSGILFPGSVILHSLGSSRIQCTVFTYIYIYNCHTPGISWSQPTAADLSWRFHSFKAAYLRAARREVGPEIHRHAAWLTGSGRLAYGWYTTN